MAYQSVWHRVVWLHSQPEWFIINSGLYVRDWHFWEIVDSKWRRKVSGVGQDDAKRRTDRTNFHPDERAWAALEENGKNDRLRETQWGLRLASLFIRLEAPVVENKENLVLQ